MSALRLIGRPSPCAGLPCDVREADLFQLSKCHDRRSSGTGGRRAITKRDRQLRQEERKLLEQVSEFTGIAAETLKRMPLESDGNDPEQAFFRQWSEAAAPGTEPAEIPDGLTTTIGLPTPSYIPCTALKTLKELYVFGTGMDVAAGLELGVFAVGKQDAQITAAGLLPLMRWIKNKVPVYVFANDCNTCEKIRDKHSLLSRAAMHLGRPLRLTSAPVSASVYDWYLAESRSTSAPFYKKAAHLRRELMPNWTECIPSMCRDPDPSPFYRALVRSNRELETALSAPTSPSSAAELAQRTGLTLTTTLEGLAFGYREGRIERRWGRPSGAACDAWLYSLAPLASQAAA